MMREVVRILLVGDEQVGKSTLITSLIKETFVPNIQHVVPEVTIPPEWTREKVTTRIVDSSPRPENREQLDTEVRRADVICIVYAINKPETFAHVGDFWLPYIRKLGRNVPVVLVGNKIDVRGKDITNEALEEQIMPIMNEFKEVETCVECSAKQPLNVSEVFYFAQKAVLHPTAPLYDSREHTLKPACIEALRRIFKLCDLDKDGILNDEEINEFQTKCFGAPLQRQELESVKEVVRENEVEGVVDNGLTEIGFLFLHTLFIQRGRLETTWTVLRRFGYGDDLSLREEFLCPPYEITPGGSVELSSDGYKFFIDLFQTFDQDKDGALKEAELAELFSTAPGNPWESTGFPETTLTDESGAVTLQGFLAQWSMTTLLDHKTTLAYLAYLGYNGDTTTALKVTRPRKADRRRGKVQRNVFLCYVFGATGSGKTALLRSLVNKPFEEPYVPTTRSYSVVNSVEIGGAEKYLVMQEFGPKFDSEVLQNRKRLEACDVLCFLYDSGDVNSFAYVANLRNRYEIDHLPCVFVATKSDTDLVPQRYDMQPDAYCRGLGLAVPISVSIKDNVTAELFGMLVGVAMEPGVAIPGTNRGPANLRVVRYVTLTATVAAIIAAGFLGYRILHNIKQSS
ncbi:small GTP-binding protein domain [Spizellomyces punctatus DAOM BR117]|uniref:Mitochondrial Rho GTPase n=1 Tax=Spizellomyces punctatus (strain DAOM BR117) TaxID=645134 RepID=A0A0L0HSI3_SPIPD|nr:small GTP-binding protein domain [Spizellomyces punctatus DAOM BR117]KND04037.1 small GTP-binding protein domain [Spizellomyces punctatus DAOM BR117]|eukprot:XP_016612076.1 small GTP-binding protein domain [Spizellomyces punctatus DAOM BR117]